MQTATLKLSLAISKLQQQCKNTPKSVLNPETVTTIHPGKGSEVMHPDYTLKPVEQSKTKLKRLQNGAVTVTAACSPKNAAHWHLSLNSHIFFYPFCTPQQHQLVDKAVDYQ